MKLEPRIEEATVDAHDESEQATSFSTTLEDHSVDAFPTEVLGMEVERIGMRDDEEIRKLHEGLGISADVLIRPYTVRGSAA